MTPGWRMPYTWTRGYDRQRSSGCWSSSTAFKPRLHSPLCHCNLKFSNRIQSSSFLPLEGFCRSYTPNLSYLSSSQFFSTLQRKTTIPKFPYSTHGLSPRIRYQDPMPWRPRTKMQSRNELSWWNAPEALRAPGAPGAAETPRAEVNWPVFDAFGPVC
jgi:hypothetical protein